MRPAIALSAILTLALLAVAATASAQQASASDPSAASAAAPPPAEATETDNAELAKKLANPIADLVSLPFQFNWENGIGPLDQTRYILNIQPVMPFSLNKDVNMIVRIIAPIVSQPAAAVPGGVATSGVSDVLTGRIERTQGCTFSIDEGADVGRDGGDAGQQRLRLAVRLHRNDREGDRDAGAGARTADGRAMRALIRLRSDRGGHREANRTSAAGTRALTVHRYAKAAANR